MAQADAQALRDAMKGLGTDEATLIKIVANRTNAQRQQIKLQYKAMFGRDLVADLKSDLHGKFEDAMVALFSEPIVYDCEELRKAMKGLGTNEDTLIEIIASRPAPVLQQIPKILPKMLKFKNHLVLIVKEKSYIPNLKKINLQNLLVVKIVKNSFHLQNVPHFLNFSDIMVIKTDIKNVLIVEKNIHN